MTYDPTAVYRTAQVATSSPVGQVVLLYEGAIRFAALSVTSLERGDPEAAHKASLRAQAIVGALRESLDLSQGDVAQRLDSLYAFMGRRLVAGNVALRQVQRLPQRAHDGLGSEAGRVGGLAVAPLE